MTKKYNRDQLASMRVALKMEVDAAKEAKLKFEKTTGVPSLFYDEQYESLSLCLNVIESLEPITFNNMPS